MTEPFEHRLSQALNELIHGRPIEGEAVRATAVRTLTDLFLEAVRRDVSGLPSHFCELMTALLPRVSLEVRSETAVRLAHCDLLPVEIVSLLVADDYEVAGPVLRQSPLIGEAELLAAALGPCPRKARAVAGRGQLSPHIVAALLDRGDSQIAAILAECQAELDGGEASRIALYADLPGRAAERLIDVTGLGDGALAALFWRVESAARRRIISRFARRRDSLPPSEPGEGSPLAMGVDDNAAARINAVDGRALGGELLQLAATRRKPEIAARLAEALKLPDGLARRIVEDTSGEALAVAGRAAGLSIEHVTGLVLLTASEPASSYAALRGLVDLAERLDDALAAHLVSLWRAALSPREVRPRSARHAPAVAQPGARRRPTAAPGVGRAADRPAADMLKGQPGG